MAIATNHIAVFIMVFCVTCNVVHAAFAPRDTSLWVADPIVHGIEEVFAPTDAWIRLLLYTAPFDYTVQAQALLIAQFATEIAISNYDNLCTAYSKAALKTSSRLNARVATRSLLRHGQTITAEDAYIRCVALKPSSFPQGGKQRAMLHSLRLLHGTMPSGPAAF